MTRDALWLVVVLLLGGSLLVLLVPENEPASVEDEAAEEFTAAAESPSASSLHWDMVATPAMMMQFSHVMRAQACQA